MYQLVSCLVGAFRKKGMVLIMAQTIPLEQQMKELDGIIELLERGGLSLEESIKLYEQGMALQKKCKKTLDAYEKRINVVINGKEEKLEAQIDE